MRILQTVIICVVFSILSMVCSESTQETPKLKAPSPIGGYSALQDSIKYPALLWKAHIESTFKVNIQLDSAGTIFSINFDHFFGGSLTKTDSAFFPAVSYAVRSVTWSPAVIDGRPIPMQVSVPILFLLTDNLQQTYEVIKKGGIPTFRTSALTISHEKGYQFRCY